MTSTPASPTVQTLRARTPEDLLALVPVVLGFEPTGSVVMLTFDAEHPFHARVDLPDTAEDAAAVADLLLDPAAHHGVGRVVLLLYATDPDDPALAAIWRELREGCDARADRPRRGTAGHAEPLPPDARRRRPARRRAWRALRRDVPSVPRPGRARRPGHPAHPGRSRRRHRRRPHGRRPADHGALGARWTRPRALGVGRVPGPPRRGALGGRHGPAPPRRRHGARRRRGGPAGAATGA